ncbi:MAG TPA: GLPGLI family protein [Dinghuibacter sp.]|jgi:GLPGLI family protein|uniref:GLPGLI family protein n=1 Tax=Dinghuibacter sp. TaxID=2024697 RepID=UPI002C2349BE|nr:GLPGLI family protein [Dinghuibacter sp.]HTJ13803.1 GLPGLI family protein [Dinghuibacter sp.]
MRTILYIALLLLPALPGLGQDTGAVKFIHAGTIEYERKENQRNEFDGEGEFADAIKKSMPEYRITYFNLYFSGNKSLFEPGRDGPGPQNQWTPPGSTNIVYADRDAGKQVSQKEIFGSTVLLSDTLRALHWRMTPDTRVIAGFECHRATTVILDTVFVVAFYTDELLSPTGPESMGGLPGTILGMVVPKLHTSWYATKVELGEPKAMAPPKKGSKVNYQQLDAQLTSSIGDWGDWGKKYIMRLML